MSISANMLTHCNMLHRAALALGFASPTKCQAGVRALETFSGSINTSTRVLVYRHTGPSLAGGLRCNCKARDAAAVSEVLQIGINLGPRPAINS